MNRLFVAFSPTLNTVERALPKTFFSSNHGVHSKGHNPLLKLAYYGIILLVIFVFIIAFFPSLLTLFEKITGQINNAINEFGKVF